VRPAWLAALPFALALAAPSTVPAEEDLAVSGSSLASFSFWDDRGSAFFPAGSAAAYFGSAKADLRAEAGELSRCAFEGSISIDAATGELSFSARELWVEWRPVSAIALRLGRQRLGFGSGLGWNPSNDLDPRRDPSDPTAPRRGADAAQLRLEAGDASGFPLSLSAVAMLPSSGIELSDARLGAQAYALIGGVELMAACSAAGLGGETGSWLAGGWATLPLGSLVIGVEGSARLRSDLVRPGSGGLPVADRKAHYAAVATATLRSGDLVAVGEVYWDDAAYSRGELDAILASGAAAAWAAALCAPGSVGELHALGRLAWTRGDLSLSADALADLETGAFAASAEIATSFEGRATVGVKASFPGPAPALGRDDLGMPGRGWALRASVAVYF
jgi:hypothetical protein